MPGESPSARVNRLIVTKHEDTAWTLPDETGGSGADAEGPWTVEERPGRRPPDPDDPETAASEFQHGATMVSRTPIVIVVRRKI